MLAQKLDLTRQIAEEEQGYADQAKLDRNTRIQAESARAAQVRGLLDATPTANLEDQRKDMQLLTEEYERFIATNGEAGISEQLYLEAVSARLNLTKEKVEESKTAAESMQYVFTNAFKDMEASLVSFVQTGKLDFSSLAESIIADMARIAIQQSVTKPLTASLTSLFGFADGGVVNSPSLSAFSGGVYNSPQLFKFASGAGVFGEAGPEAIMPLKRGANGQLGVQASGGGGSVVVNIIEAPGKGGSQGRRSENGVDMLDIFVEKVRSAIAGDISRGTGAVPNAMSQTYGLNRVAGAY
jgi:phage-related minor tail protein